ncbi:MAG: fibrinogen-like YCDxxxxGGGW domain-containing protein, partial [Beutenbergiaceae bacterium]
MRIRTIIAVVTFALVGTIALWALPTPSQAAPTEVDGLSEATAATSCWEIKQKTPRAPSGVYWLFTPAMGAPQQFYCDQTTDGGGWVLIGRGREGWRSNYFGQDPGRVHTVITGTAAFAPAQLASNTIDELMNNRRVDGLTDGIRLRRATNANGTAWQEGRFWPRSMPEWAWGVFGSEVPVARYTLGNSSRAGGLVQNFGHNQRYLRVVTNEWARQRYLWGFAYGSQVVGSPAATSYVWSAANGVGYARPFTQVFIRPQHTVESLGLTPIPDSGTPAQAQGPLAEAGAMTTTWGVAGLANGVDSELSTEVSAFGEAAGRVFVGGNFRFVQQNAAGQGRVRQSYLAAFDVETGDLIPSFNPVFNGQVKSVMGLPDGRIAVGGQFSRVNGVVQRSLAILDPISGQLSGWQVRVENRLAGAVPQVLGLDVQDDWLYVAGTFTHITSAGLTWSASTWNGGRINLTTGESDINWNAFLNGTTTDVDASDNGGQVYFSGYFKYKQSTFNPYGIALQSAAGAPLASPRWTPRFSKTYPRNPNPPNWQFGVQEAGGQVWLGGSQHSLFSYNTNSYRLQRGNITRVGGDFQTVDAGGTPTSPLIYAGCHCGDFVYQGTASWPVVTGFERAGEINLIAAWDARTGMHLPEFAPSVRARKGYGAWGSFQDSTGVLWIGGDFAESVQSNGAPQWSGGFVRFAPRDTQAPTTPAGFTATQGAAGVTLSWQQSTDDRSDIRYEVLREDRVIGTTRSLSMVVPAAAESQRYFVRAVDAADNWSASTSVLNVEPTPGFVPLVALGSQWSWRYEDADWPAGWAEPGFDASSWASGDAVLGV